MENACGRANQMQVDTEFEGVELPVPEGESAYYYLRLRQVYGHLAWLSPVWFDWAK